MKKLGFIGAGNMASAILEGILTKGLLTADQVCVFDPDAAKLDNLKARLGIIPCGSNEELLEQCETILLAVKPNICGKVLEPIAELFDGKVLISIVTGWDMDKLHMSVHTNCRILRVMPNTPCMVGEGMCAFDSGYTLNENELAFAKSIFESTGRVVVVPANLMNAVTGVSGSGPAYVYMFIEALADGGVRAGLSRDMAYELAAQTVIGAGKMVLETGIHPGALKDAVCSPGGTTIEAVSTLETFGMRAAVINAVDACVKKAESMHAK